MPSHQNQNFLHLPYKQHWPVFIQLTKNDIIMYCRIKHSGLLKNRFAYFQLGLIIAISSVFFAFNMEFEHKKYTVLEEDWDIPQEIIQDVPITRDVPKVPPPPQPKAKKVILPVESIPEPEVAKEEPKQVEPPVQYVKAGPVVKKVVAPKVIKKAPKPKVVELPPDPIEDEEEKVLDYATIMPMFPGCDEGEYQDKKTCAEKKMLEFIYKNIKYPSIAREVGTQGITVIQFVVGKDGSISKIKSLKDLGSGCTKEAIKVIKKMPNWKPGIQNGRPVKVHFRLPIRFTLN